MQIFYCVKSCELCSEQKIKKEWKLFIVCVVFRLQFRFHLHSHYFIYRFMLLSLLSLSILNERERKIQKIKLKWRWKQSNGYETFQASLLTPTSISTTMNCWWQNQAIKRQSKNIRCTILFLLKRGNEMKKKTPNKRMKLYKWEWHIHLHFVFTALTPMCFHYNFQRLNQMRLKWIQTKYRK